MFVEISSVLEGMPLFLGAGIFGSVLKFAGGLLSDKTNKSVANQNIGYQREFAQKGIRWKVEDAKAAGLHPLAALGAQTHSFAPNALPGSGVGDAMQQIGSDITRSRQAKMTNQERLSERLLESQIEGQEIENAYRASRLARLNYPTQMPPALPGGITQDPSRFTSARSGAPWLEAAPPSPGVKEFEYKTGGTYDLPSEQAKQAIEDVLPYEIEHYMMNRIFPGVQHYFTEKIPGYLAEKAMPYARRLRDWIRKERNSTIRYRRSRGY